MRSIKPAGQHAKPHDLLCRPSRTASHTLHPACQVRLEPVQCSTTDAEEDLEPRQQDVVVDGIKIKCCGQVKQGEYRQVVVVDCIQNASQYFQHDRRGMSGKQTAGVAEVCCRQGAAENDTLEKLRHHR